MTKTFWERAVQILSILVIPLILWGVKLEVRLAVQNQQIEILQKDVQDALSIKGAVAQDAVLLGRLEEKINATNETLHEVKNLLQSHYH